MSLIGLNDSPSGEHHLAKLALVPVTLVANAAIFTAYGKLRVPLKVTRRSRLFAERVGRARHSDLYDAHVRECHGLSECNSRDFIIETITHVHARPQRNTTLEASFIPQSSPPAVLADPSVIYSQVRTSHQNPSQLVSAVNYYQSIRRVQCRFVSPHGRVDPLLLAI